MAYSTDSLSSLSYGLGTALTALSDDEPLHDQGVRPPALLHRWSTNQSILALETTSNRIFAGTQGGEIIVYDLATYEEVARLQGHNGSVYAVAVLPGSQLLVTGASDSLVKVWNLESLTEVYTVYSVYDVGDIFSLAWAPGSQTLYFGAQNTSIQWIKLSERAAHETSDPSRLPSLRFDRFFDSKGPGGRMSPLQQQCKGSPKTKTEHHLLQVDPENVIQFAHYGYVYTMLIGELANGSEVLISGGGDGTVKVWELLDGHPHLKRAFTTEDESGVLSMAYEEGFLYCGLANGMVMTFDLDTMQKMRVDRGAIRDQDVMSLSMCGDCLFKGSGESVYKWSPKSNVDLRWKAHEGQILCSTICPPGKLTTGGTPQGTPRLKLITGGGDSTVAVWDIGELIEATRSPNAELDLLRSGPIDDDNMIKTLAHLVSYKTVSGPSGDYANDCRRCASYLRNLLRRLGAESQLIPLDRGGNPIVYGLFKGSDTSGRRILFYGHYDVIDAPRNDSQWRSDPFELTPRNGYLYGRGVSDNKGPTTAAIYAAAQLHQTGQLENDIVFLIEGEEENGSFGFEEGVTKHRALIGDIDWILLSNSYWLDDTTPCLNYGLRGTINCTIEISSGRPDLHSGVHGGLFPEPTLDMVKLLATLADDRNRITIPGFYDPVRKIDKWEEELYEAIVRETHHKHDKDTLMKKWRYPSMTIHRVWVSGPGNSTVIPATVSAQVSFRIVPDQDLATIKKALVHHLRDQFTKHCASSNSLSITFANEALPWVGDPHSKPFQLMRNAIKDAWGGVDPLFIREGGSIPVVPVLENLFPPAGALQLPCGQASDGAHLDNERLRVMNLLKTRKILERVFVQF
ncbi:probable di- and tripeptidase Dug2p [Trichomonascus vanleenenianus]|uniref:glutamine amidotransferase subunit DUG2 n=1 Tax=Trichomonascus vanleenenianus TaxID=2268995 RepID=UPI003ECB09AF